jgi:hypothetical protein
MVFIDTHATTRMPLKDLPDCREQPVCDPRPVCPVCGGLECLCRPRFFAGQLLTEDDLNRLERYVIDKNRLHNRYLFGSGVACGLEVVCTVCDDGSRGKVVVKPGYALSPCGNDIVVCRTEAVDVCDLINRCRPQTDECLQPHAGGVECIDAAEDWVLAICYDEKPSRGITALRGAGAAATCKCGCSCGGCGCGGSNGSAHGGCGCQGKGMAYAPKPSATPKFVAAQCEPTLICEGYRFVAYKAPKKTDKTVVWGDLIKRFVCCIRPLIESLGQLPQEDTSKDALHDWYLELKQTVRDFIIDQGLYDCEVVQKFSAVQDPQKAAPDSAAYQAQWNAATVSVLTIAVLVLQKCLCAALLPPCPEPALADCVPLATVTVRRNPCRVVRICNLSARRFLVTFPNLEYWLSWIPLFGSNIGQANQPLSLRQLLERMCCTPIADRITRLVGEGIRLQRAPAGAAHAATAGAPGAAAGATNAFTELMWTAATQPQPKMDAARFLFGAMGATDANRQPLATDDELAQPAAALLLSQVVGPALHSLLPLETTRTPGAALAQERTDDVGALARSVADLQATVDRQQREIDQLRNR